MSGGMVEVAKATVTIIPTMQGAQKSISDALTPAAEQAGTKGGTGAGEGLLNSLSSALSGGISKLTGTMGAGGAELGGALSAGLGGALSSLLPVAAAVAIGSVLLDIGQQFEEVENTIIIGTGASGDALAGMVNDVKNVTNAIPAGLGETSSVIADLNTRMGLSGDVAEDLARQILEVGKMTGKAVDVHDLTSMFAQFKIEGADATAAMDTMWAVSQNTGIGFNELAGVLGTNAAQLQMLGFSFEESAAMAGALDKAGVDASGVMSKMSKALTTLAKDGEEPQAAFQRVTGEIQNFINEGNDAAALDLASQLFGTKGATQFVNAVKSGAMNVDNLASVTELAGGNIDETAQQTMTLGDKFQIMGNRAINALEPLGSGLLDAITPLVDGLAAGVGILADEIGGKLVPFVMSLFDAFAGSLQPAIEPLIEYFYQFADTFSDVTKEGGPLHGVLNSIGSMLKSVFSFLGSFIAFILSTVVPIFGTIIQALEPLISFIWEVCNVVGAVISTVFSFIAALAQTIVNFVTGAENATAPLEGFFAGLWEAIMGVVQSVWQAICDFIGGIINAIWTAISSVFTGIYNTISTVLNAAWAVVSTVWNAISAAISAVVSFIYSVVSTYFNMVYSVATSIFSAVSGFVSSIWNGIRDTISGAVSAVYNAVSSAFSAVYNTASSIFGAVAGVTSSVWGGISSTIGGIVNGISSTVSSVFGGISSTVSGIWNGIRDTISGAINGARDAVSMAIDAIKGIFNITLNFPEIRMPSIKVDGGEAPFGIAGQGRLPSFWVEWNAEGGLFMPNKPVVLQGFGDANVPEAALPLTPEVLRGIGEGVAENMEPTIDYDRLARALARELQRVEVNIDGRQFGRFVRAYG